MIQNTGIVVKGLLQPNFVVTKGLGIVEAPAPIPERNRLLKAGKSKKKKYEKEVCYEVKAKLHAVNNKKVNLQNNLKQCYKKDNNLKIKSKFIKTNKEKIIKNIIIKYSRSEKQKKSIKVKIINADDEDS